MANCFLSSAKSGGLNIELVLTETMLTCKPVMGAHDSKPASSTD